MQLIREVARKLVLYMEGLLVTNPGKNSIGVRWLDSINTKDEYKIDRCAKKKSNNEKEGFWRIQNGKIVNRRVLSRHGSKMNLINCFDKYYRPVYITGKRNYIYSLLKVYLDGNKKRKLYLDKAIVLGGWVGDIGNYFHTWCDTVGDYVFLKENNLIKGEEKFLIVQGNGKWENEVFSVIGVPKESIVKLNDFDLIMCEELIVPHRKKGGPEIPAWLPCAIENAVKKNLKNEELKNSDRGKLIFIHRSDSNRRKSPFEDEIFNLLEEYGFLKFVASNYSVVDQIKIFEKARIIIGVHGAGFKNILFAPNGCSIIEINENNYRFECFENISKIKNMNYRQFNLNNQMSRDEIKIVFEKLKFEIREDLNNK